MSKTAQPCTYRDRRGRVCQAAFCAGHGMLVDGVTYCRRLAGVLRALGGRARHRNGLPDLDNRAPSLVGWIARDLDTNIRSLLAGVARRDEKVVVDETVHVARDHDRQPRWEQSWRLVDHSGPVLKVTIQVSETNSSLVIVRVDGGVDADAIPRWIAHCTANEVVAAAIDVSQRERFYLWLSENILLAVTRLRAHRDRFG